MNEKMTHLNDTNKVAEMINDVSKAGKEVDTKKDVKKFQEGSRNSGN